MKYLFTLIHIKFFPAINLATWKERCHQNSIARRTVQTRRQQSQHNPASSRGGSTQTLVSLPSFVFRKVRHQLREECYGVHVLMSTYAYLTRYYYQAYLIRCKNQTICCFLFLWHKDTFSKAQPQSWIHVLDWTDYLTAP